MLIRLFLLFTLVPLVELVVLLQIGARIGAAPALALVVGTGLAGAWLARREGSRSWAAVRRELEAGRLPGRELLHALLILIAGVTLITPGIFTDAAGILLLLPPVRSATIRGIRRRFGGSLGSGGIEMRTGWGSRDRTWRPGGGSGERGSDTAPGDRDDAPAEGGRVIEM